MSALPLTVIDTILRSNKGIKKCFYYEKKRTGTLPKRVDVRLTIATSGSVRRVTMATSQYAGGELDDCLDEAIRQVYFPPFQGKEMTLTYPFFL